MLPMNTRVVDEIQIHVVNQDTDIQSTVEWALRAVKNPVTFHAGIAGFRAKASIHAPCCLIIDIQIPGVPGLEFCRELSALYNGLEFIVLTGSADVSTAVEAMKLGAIDFLEKPCSSQRLLNAVCRAIQALQIEITETEEEAATISSIEQLTAREREVFEQMKQGSLSKEIASRLGISPKTVDVHRSHISQKLRFDSPAQLAHLVAVEHRYRQRVSRKVELNSSAFGNR